MRSEQNGVSRQNPHGGRLLKKKMHTVKSMERRFERERENLMPFLPEALKEKFLAIGDGGADGQRNSAEPS